MIKKVFSALLLFLLSFCIYSQSIETDFSALYIGDSESILYSEINIKPIDAVRIVKSEMVHLKDGIEHHYSLTGFSVVHDYYALRMYDLTIPSFHTSFSSNTVLVNSISMPVWALELRYPFSRASVWIGALEGDLPKMTGKVNGQNVSLGNWDLGGAYTGLTVGDLSCSAYCAVTESDTYTSWWSLGEVDSFIGLLMARWGDFGLFGAVIQGDTALQGNQLISFFSGHRFSAVGSLDMRACGGWGQVKVSSKKLTASCSFLFTCVWSMDTIFEYTESWTEAGTARERSRSGVLDWDPAALFVIVPAISYKMNKTVSIEISRVIPLAFGWEHIFLKDSGDHTSEETGSSGTTNPLNAQTLFLSGLTASVHLVFK